MLDARVVGLIDDTIQYQTEPANNYLTVLAIIFSIKRKVVYNPFPGGF